MLIRSLRDGIICIKHGLVVPSRFDVLQDDEEWNEFETDKEVDLSTLKIQNLGEKYGLAALFEYFKANL